jgi:uracil-DNA glycosylase
LIATTGDKFTIEIHQDMVLVVLGETAFKHFVGDENVQILQSLTDKDANMTQHVGALYDWVSHWQSGMKIRIFLMHF